MAPHRTGLIFTLLAASACFPATEGTGKGSGKETGGCYQGIYCDEGLQCLLGFCVASDDEDETGDGGQAVDTGDGDGDTPPPPSCGDGMLDLDEECDGGELAGESCQTLGWDMGALSCTAGCQFDLSGCQNDPQPGVGQLYSPCLDNNACPGLDGCATVVEEGSSEPVAGFCSNFCTSDAECFAEVGGSAVPECNDAASPFCHLDCSGGRTCPGGMECMELASGAMVCYRGPSLVLCPVGPLGRARGDAPDRRAGLMRRSTTLLEVGKSTNLVADGFSSDISLRSEHDVLAPAFQAKVS